MSIGDPGLMRPPAVRPWKVNLLVRARTPLPSPGVGAYKVRDPIDMTRYVFLLWLGLVWAGGMSDRKRDVPIAELLPLLRLEGVSFYSLQVGPPSRDIQRLPSGSIIDTAGLIKDFADTAGLINQLDGVLTVDTSVAHLAGALGRPVWTLLQYAPDWRWLRHRSESPWYPSMRLFRQSAPGEWKSVVAKVATDLQRVLQSPSPSQAFAALL